MKIGDYVRFKDKRENTYIRKIIDLTHPWAFLVVDENTINSNKVSEKNIIKSSPNIIDLIEVGDYVNGEKITGIGKDRNDEKIIYYEIPSDYGEDDFKNEDIKSIVTKEQFESMEYEVK